MQFQVTLTIVEAEDIFDVVKQLEPISKVEGIKVSAVTPRPQPPQKPAPLIPGAPRTPNQPQ